MIQKKQSENLPITQIRRIETTRSLTRAGATEAEADPSTTAMEGSTMQKEPTIDDIQGYVPLRKVGELAVCMNKNQNYNINMSATPKGVHMMMDIVPRLQKLQYSDHDILEYM